MDESPYPNARNFFGVCPTEITSNLFNALDDYIADGSDQLELELQKVVHQKISDEKKKKNLLEQLHEGGDELVKTIQAEFDRQIEFLEYYLIRNILHVPNDIMEEFMENAKSQEINNGHDIPHESSDEQLTDIETEGISYVPQDEKKIDEEIRLLQQQLIDKRLELIRYKKRIELKQQLLQHMKNRIANKEMFDAFSNFKQTAEELVCIRNDILENMVKAEDILAKLPDQQPTGQTQESIVRKITKTQAQISIKSIEDLKNLTNSLSESK